MAHPVRERLARVRRDRRAGSVDPLLVSVVVPAYNAAPTVLSTLSRLGRQSFPDFEVIVVDDGSTDETASIVEAAAGRDARIRLIRKSNGGVSSARNVGLGAVTGSWVLFLDADDWLDDTYLARMLAAAAAHPGSRVVRCRHARVATSGALITGPANDSDQDHFFDTLARRAMGATHAYLTETALVRDVGGFDETLQICEDWDLWQRIARTGAPLATVSDVLAYYRMRNGSLTSDGARLLADARTVLRRGMSADPRVARPDPRWAHGVPPHDIDVSLQPIAVWCATSAFVGGKPWRLLLDEVQGWGPLVDDLGLIDSFFEGFLLGHGLAAPEVAGVVDELESAAADLFGEVATRTDCPQLATSWQRRMAEIFAQVGVSGLDVRNIEIPTDGLVPSLPGAVGGEHLVIRLRFPGRTRHLVSAVRWLPIGRTGMARLLVSSLAQRTHGALRRRVVGRLAPPPGPWTTDRVLRLRRRAVSLLQTIDWRLADLAVQPAPTGVRQVDQERRNHGPRVVEKAGPTGPGTYWETFFSDPDPWHYESDYERVKTERAMAMLDGLEIGRALECACAEGHFTRELAGVVGEVRAVDISTTALGRAAERCADVSNVEFAQLDFFHEEIPAGWDLIVCSEVLYYTRDEALLASVARRLGAALAPGGLLLSAHSHLVADDPTQPGFDWEDPFGGQRILSVLAEAGDLVPVKRLVTPLYSIVLYRRSRDGDKHRMVEEVRELPVGAALSPHVESAVLWRGAVRTRIEVARELRYDVPILMYHRVTDQPNPGLTQWAVSPAAFGRQMDFLRRRGFHTMSMQQLVEARRDGRPVAGRPIILSFDDAYVDFAEHCLPVLRRRGFGATVFTPTNHLGGAADWDARFGSAAPIMDRVQLSEVAQFGIELGSHLHTHTRVDQLSFNDLLQEALESRRIIAEITGTPPRVIATPYGFLDAAALSILRTAGFDLVATTDHGIASLLDAGRAVPRLEVSDGSLTHLCALLEPIGCEPPTADELAAEVDDRQPAMWLLAMPRPVGHWAAGGLGD